MSNVMPLEAQKETQRFYRAHVTLVGSLVLLGGACVVLVILLPQIISFVTQGASLNGTRSAIAEAEDAEEQRAQVLTAQVLVSELSPVLSSGASGLEALTTALEARPSGVSISDIRYTREDNLGEIFIQGNAERSLIVAYRDALLEQPLFENVSVPASALAGAEDGRFSITLEGAF